MKRDTVSIKIDPKLWKRAKIYVAKHDTTLSDLVEKSLIEKMKNR